LAAVGKPIEASKLVTIILVGLGPEYDPLVTSVTTRQDSISLNELYGFMLSYEMRLEQHKSTIDLSISTANTAQRQNHPIHITIMATTLASATQIFPAVEAVAEEEDHLRTSRSLALANLGVLLVRFVKNKVTLQQHVGSDLSKDIKLILLPCMQTSPLPPLHLILFVVSRYWLQCPSH